MSRTASPTPMSCTSQVGSTSPDHQYRRMYTSGWNSMIPRSTRTLHTQMMAEMMCWPRLSQRKLQTQISSQRVMNVGISADSPRRKNRRKSSENPSFFVPRGAAATRSPARRPYFGEGVDGSVDFTGGTSDSGFEIGTRVDESSSVR